MTVMNLLVDMNIRLATNKQLLDDLRADKVAEEESRLQSPPLTHANLSTSTGCWAINEREAYHIHFPAHILQQTLSTCHLEALNAKVALKLWAPKLATQVVHLFCDNATVMAIFQAGRGRDPFLQACTSTGNCGSHVLSRA